MLRPVRWCTRQRPRVPRLMLRVRRCSEVLGALVAGAAALLAATPGAEASTCAQRNYVNFMGLVIGANGAIRATSSNGETYDRIEGTSFSAKIDIDLCYPGALDGIILHLGGCTGHRRACDTRPIMFGIRVAGRGFHSTREFKFSVPTDSDLGKNILASCNAVVDQARGAQKDIFPSVGILQTVTLGVDTRIHRAGRQFVEGCFEGCERLPLGEYSKTRIFEGILLPFACAPLPVMSTAPPKITEAALGVHTSGKTCPKPATGDAIIAAEAPRDVFYKIERGNGTTTTDDWIQGRIKMQKGPTGANSAFLRAEHDLGALDPGTRKFRLWIDTWGKTPWREVEVDCPPFKVVSAWLKYDVEDKDTCPKRVAETATFKATRPGKAPFQIKTAGGLVVHSGAAVFEREGMGYVARVERPNLMMSAFDSEMMALIKTQPDANSGWVRLKVECLEVLSGKVTLKSLGTGTCQGEALVAIHTNGSGELPYELECGSGRSWQRSVTVPGNKIGVDKVRFDVRNNERVTCILRTRIAGKLKSLDGTSMTFQCHRPTGVSSTDELVLETKPDPIGPRPPRVVVDPPPPPRDDARGPGKLVDPPRPRISCAGGTVRNGECHCPSTHKAVHAGNNAWRCIRIVRIDPPRKLQVKAERGRKALPSAAGKRGARKAAR